MADLSSYLMIGKAGPGVDQPSFIAMVGMSSRSG